MDSFAQSLSSSTENLSVVHGPTNIELWNITLRDLIEIQAKLYHDREAVIFPWQGVHLTYGQLCERSKAVARSLLAAGLQHGDKVGIFAGNCYQYIETFLGAGRLGCPVVVLNNTYTPQELLSAVVVSRCKVLVMGTSIGARSLSEHVQILSSNESHLEHLILLASDFEKSKGAAVPKLTTFDEFMNYESSRSNIDEKLRSAEETSRPDDVLNLQFTSGTTGNPKAAMLTHMNVINNGRLVGDRMGFGPESIVCCPPPLFHCFGLVMGFLGAFTHGSSIVFPSEAFDPDAVLDSLATEKCTSIYGVPTMFVAILDLVKKKNLKITTVKNALAAGSPVPQAVMKLMDREMGIKDVLIAYGMTETSPVTFMTSSTDSLERKLGTVGTALAHIGAKIVDKEGRIVPHGVRGEICTSGFALQKGYYENEMKTKEVMKTCENGILWMHTGDEGIIDKAGYCAITGRIKDMLIRGGENIFPVEIEERLLAHPSIGEASVVGHPDERYGEAVACFLRHNTTLPRPSTEDVANWVKDTLGRHKAPKHVLWIGDPGVGEDFPKTGSGKHQKHILRDIARRIIKPEPLRARL